MHILLFHYRLPQLYDKSIKALSLQHRLGYSLPPLQGSPCFQTTVHSQVTNTFSTSGKSTAEGAELANQHCYKQFNKALSLYIHILLYTYVQVKLKSTGFS